MTKKCQGLLASMQILQNFSGRLNNITGHKVYFIRHAPTKVNLTGEMMNRYDEFGAIIPFDVDVWQNNVGKFIDWDTVGAVWTSSAIRTIQTAQAIIGGDIEIDINKNLNEFDCSGLGDKKFWEVSEEEFNTLTKLDGKACRFQIAKLFDEIADWIEENDKDLVCITHGMFTRLMYTVLTNNGDHSMYDIINSKTFQFRNLDMLTAKVVRGTLVFDNIYRNEYKELKIPF